MRRSCVAEMVTYQNRRWRGNEAYRGGLRDLIFLENVSVIEHEI